MLLFFGEVLSIFLSIPLPIFWARTSWLSVSHGPFVQNRPVSPGDAGTREREKSCNSKNSFFHPRFLMGGSERKRDRKEGIKKDENASTIRPSKDGQPVENG